MPSQVVHQSDEPDANPVVAAAEIESSVQSDETAQVVDYSPAIPLEHRPIAGLLSWSFFGLLCLQFLTVLNDNTYRWLATPLGYEILGPQHKSMILTLGVACFAVPYMVLMAPAGYLGDRFSKRNVMAACMLLQAGIIVFGMGSILLGSVYLVFTNLAVMGAQGALLGPARLGAVPETVRENRISAANGLIGMASVLAAVVGSILGNYLYVVTGPDGKTHWWISGGIMLTFALLGWAATFLITKRPAADPARPFPKHAFKQTSDSFKAISRHPDLLGAACASGYLWFMAALAQVNVYLLGTTILDINQAQVGPLLAMLAGGVAIGSVIAGIWSGGRVDPGLTPIGAVGIIVSAVAVYLIDSFAPSGSDAAYYGSCVALFGMGASAGLYDVPLASYLQNYTPEKSRGEILAASNFLIFGAMLIAAGGFWILSVPFGLSAPQIFLIAGGITTIVFFVVLSFVHRQTVDALGRPVRWLRRVLGGHAN